MFAKMKKTKNVIILAIVSVLLAFFGFFCLIGKDHKNMVSANADEASTTIMESFALQGMGLLLSREYSAVQIGCYITEEIYNNLNLDEYSGGWLNLDDRYHYELRLYRHPVGTTFQDASTFEYWDFDKEDFSKDEDGNGDIDQAEKRIPYMHYQYNDVTGERLVNIRNIPCTSNYNQEYNYTVVFHLVHRRIGLSASFDGEINYEDAINTETITRSVAGVAKAASESGAYNNKEWALNILNYYQGIVSESGVTYPITFTYKKMTAFGVVEDIVETYDVDSVRISVSSFVYEDIMGRIFASTSLSNVNCEYIDEDTGLKFTYLEAVSYEYNFDTTTNTGALNIIYEDFTFSKFALFLQDNDTEDGVNYIYPFYATSGNYTEGRLMDNLYFEFSYIQGMCKAAFNWDVELSADDFVWDIPEDSTVDIDVSDAAITIIFDDESDLGNVFVRVNAEIIEDYLCDVEVVYRAFTYNGNEVEEDELSKTFTMWYSEKNRISLPGAFADSDCYALVDEGMKLYDPTSERLLDVRYAEYNGISVGAKEEGDERPKFTITVKYTYHTLLQTHTYIKGDFSDYKLIEVSPYSRYIYYDTFSTGDYSVCCSNISVNDIMMTTAIVFADYEDLKKSYVNYLCGANEARIITVTVEYTDTFDLSITYMDQYNDTPFAIQTTRVVKGVNVTQYPTFPNVTLRYVKALLGETDLSVTKLVSPAGKTSDGIMSTDDTAYVTLERSNDKTYSVELVYGFASLMTIAADGTHEEMQIYLTPYTAFLESMGREDYSIMQLNRTGVDEDGKPYAPYFKYANSVDIDKLYGLFATVTFKEQVKNLADWFAYGSSDGAIVHFQTKEVRGSNFYKAFDVVQSGYSFGIEIPAIKNVWGGFATVAKCFCEIVNDENATYHSYYTYMDGTTAKAFVSNGGSDSIDDEDNSIENGVQDVVNGTKDTVSDWFDGIVGVVVDVDTSKLGFIFGVAALLLIGGVIVFAFTRSGNKPKRK